MEKILILIGKLDAGGGERNACLLANQFLEDGYSVSVGYLLPSLVFYSLDSKVKVFDLSNKKRPKSFFSWKKKIVDLYRREKFDVIISFFFSVSVVALLSIKDKKPIFICRETGDPKTRNFWRFAAFNFFLKKADHIVFQTEYEKSCYSKGIRKKGVVLKNPVVHPAGHYENCLNKKTWVSVGRLSGVKDQETIIRGFSIFHKKHNDYHLKIYGKGPSEEQLRKLISELNLDNSVSLCGLTHDVFEVFQDGCGFILASKNEGMPNALLEAKVFGLPIITSKWPGYQDVVRPGADALVFDAGDALDLSEKMEALALDNCLRNTLIANCIASSGEYSIRLIASQWEKLFKRGRVDK
jgi:GalNAc-alpha-(1->4)-GalNAc-alpha-(1->3)-diNAcBac-PP-undecaprenol alpha-1,4-N-acetyl-D-galactosaminyltransferase